MRWFLTALAACAAGLSLAAGAQAHHSRAAYDMSQQIVLDGTVVELAWKNPHIFMTVEIEGPDAETISQEVEVMSVSEARVLGLPREAIPLGAHVVVRVHPGRRGLGARAVGLDVRTDDGSLYPLNTDANFAIAHATPAPAAGIAGHWAPTLESFNAFWRAMAAWPLTEAGQATAAAATERENSTSVAGLGICEPVPPPSLAIFPDVRTIEVSDTTVVLRFEGPIGVDMVRVVHLDLAEHRADLKPSVMGHSIGRWEDGTLVIDTTAFTPHAVGAFLLPSGPDKHLIERLTLSEDRLHLEYVVELEEPTLFAAPVTYAATWDYRPDLDLSGEACDPAAARRPLED